MNGLSEKSLKYCNLQFDNMGPTIDTDNYYNGAVICLYPLPRQRQEESECNQEFVRPGQAQFTRVPGRIPFLRTAS